MPNYIKYTNKQIAEELTTIKTVTPELIKEVSSRISQTPDPIVITAEMIALETKQREDQKQRYLEDLIKQKITWANEIQLCGLSFEQQGSDLSSLKTGQLFYPELKELLEIKSFQQDNGSKIGATADCELLPIIKRQFKQATKLTNIDMTKDVWDEYQIYNQKLFEVLPVFVASAGVFVLRKNVQLTESTMLNALELNQVDDWNSKLLKLQNLLGDSPVIINTGLVIELPPIWTGEVKEFKFKFLGSMVNSIPYSDEGTAQYSLL